MENLQKTARVLDVLARIALCVSLALILLVLGILVTAREIPELSGALSSALTAGAFHFILAEPVSQPWAARLVLAALACAVSCYEIAVFRRILRPMREGRPFDGVARRLRTLAWVTLVAGFFLSLGDHLVSARFYHHLDYRTLFLNGSILACSVEIQPNLNFLWPSLLLLLLSFVFRYGEELQRQADETL